MVLEAKAPMIEKEKRKQYPALGYYFGYSSFLATQGGDV
jgi:hypothetical protein